MFSETPDRYRTRFSEKWEKLFFVFLVYFPWCLLLMHNFRKKYEFPWRSPGRTWNNVSPIFGCFFVVNHQEPGVMHKKGEIYTTCSPRSKINHICQKMFFGNFARFYKIMRQRAFWCCTLFLAFLWKYPIFSGGSTSGNTYRFAQILVCVFVVYHPLTEVTIKNGVEYLPG